MRVDVNRNSVREVSFSRREACLGLLVLPAVVSCSGGDQTTTEKSSTESKSSHIQTSRTEKSTAEKQREILNHQQGLTPQDTVTVFVRKGLSRAKVETSYGWSSEYSFRNVSVISHKAIRPLGQHEEIINEGHRDLRVVLESDSDTEEISLPPELSPKILQFISGTLPNGDKARDLDCDDFVRFIYGHEYEGPNQLDIRAIRYDQIFDSSELEPGDVVFAFHNAAAQKTAKSAPGGNTAKKKTFDITRYHFAMYLGNDLYLSKFPRTTSFIVCSLPEMVKAWGTNVLCKAEDLSLRAKP